MRIDATVNPRMVEFENALKMQRAEMSTIRDRLDARFRKNELTLFRTEGASGGKKWKPVKDKKAKRRHCKGTRKTMVCSGTLRAGLTQMGHADHIAEFQVVKPSVDLGTKNVVAAYHADFRGNFFKNRSLPNRDTLQYTKAQGQEYTGIFADYMIKTKLPRVFKILRAWSRARS